MVLQLYGLGNQPPVVYDEKSGAIAQPNTSLAQKGADVPWDCNDWMLWHKALVKMFMKGQVESGIKYTSEKATELANQVFKQHWTRASAALTRCGYTSDFYQYFNSVGLASIFNLAHRTANATVQKGSKIVDSVSNTLVNVVDDAGEIVTGATSTVSNVANLGKYLVPVAIGGVVLLVGGYVYKNYIAGNARVQVGVATI